MMFDFSAASLDSAVQGAYGKKSSAPPQMPPRQKLSGANPQLQAEEETPSTDGFSFDAVTLNNAVRQAMQAQPAQQSNVGGVAQGIFGKAKEAAGAVLEPIATLATGTQAAVVGPITGLVAAARSGKYGTQEGVKIAQEQAKRYAEETTYQPRTEAGKQVVGAIGEVAGKLGELGPLPETYAFAPLASAAAGQAKQAVAQPVAQMAEQFKAKLPTVRMEKGAKPAMQGMGAAEVDAARLRRERGNELLVPMGDDMTKGQLTRNPADVTFERETAKSPEFGGPFQEKFALQNRKLQQNLQAEVDATGAEMVGMDAPQFGKNIADAVQTYKNNRYQEVSNAYKAAQEAGETAQPVSYKGILDLISKETEGRPTKKAQNPLYSIVEEELKANDPQGTGLIPINAMEDIRKLINEEADPSKKGSVRLGKQLKGEIDKATENAGGDLYKEARAKNRAFEAEFEDQGIIRDINRLKKGTTDRVVPLEALADKLVFKGTGSDVQAVFATLEKMGPEGQQLAKELKGYAAEKIRQEATKGVGRDIEGRPYVSTAALDKEIKALDKSGKLDFLFGPEQAQRYRTLNEYTKDLQTVPQGTVNTSGTTATLLSALAEMGASTAMTGVPAPVATIATYGYKHHQAAKKMKKVQEYVNYGTKLSDIGKEQK
jgi:hypothetical protein